jgi:hypothetical protein
MGPHFIPTAVVFLGTFPLGGPLLRRKFTSKFLQCSVGKDSFLSILNDFKPEHSLAPNTARNMDSVSGCVI